MIGEELREFVNRFNEDALFADGFDNAVIGIVERFGMREPIVLYDRTKVIAILMQHMSEEEAVEHFEFNIIGAWMGDNTPAFATLWHPRKKAA